MSEVPKKVVPFAAKDESDRKRFREVFEEESPKMRSGFFVWDNGEGQVRCAYTEMSLSGLVGMMELAKIEIVKRFGS